MLGTEIPGSKIRDVGVELGSPPPPNSWHHLAALKKLWLKNLRRQAPLYFFAQETNHGERMTATSDGYVCP